MKELKLSEMKCVSGGFGIVGIIGAINGYKGDRFCKNAMISTAAGAGLGVMIATCSEIHGPVILALPAYYLAEGLLGYATGRCLSMATS